MTSRIPFFAHRDFLLSLGGSLSCSGWTRWAQELSEASLGQNPHFHLTVKPSFVHSFSTKLAKAICADPKEKWVQDYVKHLNQKSHALRT